MTRKELFSMVLEGRATSESFLCAQTNKPIMLGDNYYYIGGDRYHEDADVDKVVADISEGTITTWEEWYEDDGDDYMTTLEDASQVMDDIMDDGYYYTTKGEEIEIELTF